MIIANIIIDKGRNLLNVENFIFVSNELPNVVDIPTIIIGWELVKKLFPDQSILNKSINENLFWTFTKNEKRIDYDKDINNFYNYVISNILDKKLKYYYFDIFKFSFNKIKNLLNLINSNTEKYIYIYNNSFIYLYSGKYVIGISIEDLEYMKINREKIMNILKQNKSNHIFYSNDFISDDIKKIINQNKYIIPYLRSIL